MKITAQDINQLTPSERLDLIERLWDSLNDDQVPLDPEVRAELKKRLATYDEDRAQEAVQSMLEGDVDTGKSVLCDYINATVSFDELSKATGKPPRA